tara:strand:+ start:108 stop:1034 length:927 start_codon:yes stop_codon:yes gene_type:complete
MRNKFSNVLAQFAEKNKKIYIVVADISPAGAMEEFQRKNPERFINVGVAEQTMISVCAGLSMKGMRPFAYTISTFALYRPFEMVRTDLCYQNLPVTVVGMGAGSIYSTLGATHLTQEDVSIAKSIPNMQIIAPCDPDELSDALKYCIKDSKKPTYLRIGKAGEKTFSNNSEKWKFGKIRKLNKGKEICFLSFGPIIRFAFEISETLKKNGINPSIYSCHTLKPFDKEGLKKIFKNYQNIVIIEDHSEIGGLGEIVKVLAYENNYKGVITAFGLKDKFIHCYGDQNDLLEKHGISKNSIYKKLKKILKI